MVTICGLNDIIVYSQHREGVKNLLSPEESNKSLGLAINSWKIRSELVDKILVLEDMDMKSDNSVKDSLELLSKRWRMEKYTIYTLAKEATWLTVRWKLIELLFIFLH